MTNARSVRVSSDGLLASIRPEGYLGDELFAEFRRAIDGARFVREKRANLAPLDKVPTILVRLREHGFDVRLDSDVREKLQERNVQRWADREAVKERIERIDADIRMVNKKNGLGHGLFAHQRVAATWLALRHAALLADEMGVGKSLSAIVALPAGSPCLVVAPAALKDMWAAEFKKWRPQLRIEILKGKSSFRWPRQGEILITNYDVLPEVHDVRGVKGRRCKGLLDPERCPGCKDEIVFQGPIVTTRKNGHLPACTGFLKPRRCSGCAPILDEALSGTVGIWDEAHKAKSGTSGMGLRTRALCRAIRAKDGRTWTMTGTPMENGPKDLWYVMDAAGVAEECFGTWRTFVETFKGRTLDHGRYAWGLPDDEVVERIRRGCLRRTRAEVLPDLPTKMHQELVVPVGREAVRACETLIASEGGIDRIVELLEKDAFPFERMSEARAALASAKIPALLALAAELSETEPVVVYSMHRAPIEAVGKLPGWATILGGQDDRQNTVQAFQDGKLRGLGVTIQTGGTGFTLTRSSLGIFVDLSFKPTENAQAEDRQVRIGQTRGVRFIVMKADHPLDKRVTEILMAKRRIIAASVDAASVGADPAELADRAVEEELRRLGEVVANGNAVRRPAATEEEKDALDRLCRLCFEKESDERVAASLAEQATRIGLSDAQWRLAARIAERGIELEAEPSSDSDEPELLTELREDETLEDDGPDESDRSEEDQMDKVATVGDALEIVRRMTTRERYELFGIMDATLDMTREEATRFLRAIKIVEKLRGSDRDDFMGRAAKEFCVDCAERLEDGVEHECEETDDEGDLAGDGEPDEDDDEGEVDSSGEIDGDDERSEDGR